MSSLALININGAGYWADNNNKFLGMATVDLPDIQYKKATLSGLGIAGSVNVPTLGIEPLEATIHFTAPTPDVYKLSKPKTHRIEIRSSVRHPNTATHEYRPVQDRYVLVMEPTGLKLGSIKTAEEQGLEIPITLYSLTGYHGEERILMLDPLNMIWEVDGEDCLKEVREQLGIA